MKRIILFCLFPFCAHAQFNATLYKTQPELIHKISISGMVYDKGKLYLAAERCGRIFVADASSRNITDTIMIPGNYDLEMEGITAYKNLLLIVSENDAGIYSVNPATGATKPVVHNGPVQQIYQGDGLEGIAVHPVQPICYVLLERDSSKKAAVIYSFRISGKGQNIRLHYLNAKTIALPDRNWRYSDLCFDHRSNSLWLLKSYYNKPDGKYAIEYLCCDDKGLLQGNTPLTVSGLDTTYLTEVVYKYKRQGYGSNMEGITLDPEQHVYMSSDNAMGAADCMPPPSGATEPEKTMLLLLKPGVE